MVITAFFSILLSPASWFFSEDYDFVLTDPITWGIVPRTVVQAVVGLIVIAPLLKGIKSYSPVARLLLLIFPFLPLGLHIYLETPLSGVLIVVLWGIFVYTNLLQADVRQVFRRAYRAEIRAAAQG